MAPTLYEENTALKAERDRLLNALWDLGEHKKDCPVHDGECCTCGLFDILRDFDLPNSAALGEDQ